MKAVSPDRWQASQRLELDFWKHWTEAAAYQNLDIPKYWDEELRRFNCTGEIFSGRRVLDIGCGPFGLIHYLDSARERVRIDPLLPQYEARMPLTGPQLSISGLGEHLPLATGSIDVPLLSKSSFPNRPLLAISNCRLCYVQTSIQLGAGRQYALHLGCADHAGRPIGNTPQR